MKRTNLVLSAALLDEVMRISGERTYSRAVETAMADFVRRAKARQILGLHRSEAWSGDLTVMREDRAPFGDASTARSKKKRRVAR
ncbi:MAG TPA: type II toxin-antitoxin system VapB family antitoxin [Vicinamibacterales bacterium]|nr:type II toxin-antitoxin system VapB family antitoxin [Vicinamibacterales bacterium]